MKKAVIIAILFSVFLMPEIGCTIDKKLLEDNDPFHPYVGPVTNDVRIAYSGIFMPIGRYMLIRKKNEVCALIFMKFWNKKQGSEQEHYASYISYYQDDGSSNFLGQNVKIIKGEASYLPVRSFTRLFIWQPGHAYVHCGPLKFAWSFYGGVCACEKHPGDYGFEFAPTPWENISDVDIMDKRIRWYRYDKNREDIDFTIDKILKDKD